MSAEVRLWVAVGAVTVAAVAVVGGILVLRGDDDEPPTGYEGEVADDFTAACTADAEARGIDDPAGFCACAFEAIRQRIPFDRFLEIDAALRADPTAVPPAIERIRTECYLAGTPAAPGTSAVLTTEPPD